MKYLGNFFSILIYRLPLQNFQPNSSTKSTYSMWTTLKKPPVTEKSVASFSTKSTYSTWITLKKPPVAEKVLQVLQTRGSSIQEGHGGCHGKTIL